MRKTNRQIQNEVNEIGKLLAIGLTDREIMQKLQLRRSQYYVYRSKLYDQSADLFKKGQIEDLAFHKELLQERLTRLYRQAETRLTGAAGNNTMTSKDIAQVLAMAQNIAINIFKLESEGLRILASQRNVNASIDNGYPRSIESESREVRLLPRETDRDRGGAATGVPSVVVNPEQVFDESEVY